MIQKIIKTHYKEILLFGFAYSCVIVFSLFGPIMLIVDRENASLFSIISLIFFIIAFLIKPFHFETNKKYLYIMWAVCIPFFVLINTLDTIYQAIGMSIYALMVARICKRWTVHAYNHIDGKYAGRIMSFCFFIAFLILYIVNALTPSMDNSLVIIIPLMTSGLMIVTFSKNNHRFYAKITQSKPYTKTIFISFAFLIIVYICGGVTYAGIYPFLNQFYTYDRYYNVLPLVISLPFAGMITDRLGKKITFALGAGFLGISFVFFILAHNVVVYFTTQTFLQMGWAFINVFGFSYSWEIAKIHNDKYYFGYGIVSIMIGVMCGSIIANIFYTHQIPIHIYALVTFIPLFIAMIIYSFIPDKKVSHNRLDKDMFYSLDVLLELSGREKEVIYYYYYGNSGDEIANILHVSPNTIRTHIRNVYTKLAITSKKELKSKIEKHV